jgi:hypothetical protein
MRRRLSHVIKLTAEAALLLEEIMGQAIAALKELEHEDEAGDASGLVKMRNHQR